MRPVLRKTLDAPAVAFMVSGPRDFAAYWRRDERAIRVRALGGRPVTVRPDTSDRTVLREVIVSSAHLPPISDPRLIWDLGANIGVTVAHMAELFPAARVVGVEMEPGNASIARRNIEPWADRAEIVEATVWATDGEVQYSAQAGRQAGNHIADGGGEVARAVSLNSLAAETGAPDYVKMDIEGAEREVLHTATDWAEHLPAIKVEVHGSYTVADCRADLERLGFTTREQPQPWWPPSRGRPCVVGTRPA